MQEPTNAAAESALIQIGFYLERQAEMPEGMRQDMEEHLNCLKIYMASQTRQLALRDVALAILAELVTRPQASGRVLEAVRAQGNARAGMAAAFRLAEATDAGEFEQVLRELLARRPGDPQGCERQAI